MVAAYGLAALLVRAFYPREGLPSYIGIGMVAFVYAWLGLAMGGPMVLLLDRRARSDTFEPSPYTWAETAWLMIGGYWIGLAMFVVPSRLPVTPILGVIPVIVALAVRLGGRKRTMKPDERPGWTHGAAVLMLITWPVAWVSMMALGKSMS
jgi:hypothetical protein